MLFQCFYNDYSRSYAQFYYTVVFDMIHAMTCILVYNWDKHCSVNYRAKHIKIPPKETVESVDNFWYKIDENTMEIFQFSAMFFPWKNQEYTSICHFSDILVVLNSIYGIEMSLPQPIRMLYIWKLHQNNLLNL